MLTVRKTFNPEEPGHYLLDIWGPEEENSRVRVWYPIWVLGMTCLGAGFLLEPVMAGTSVGALRPAAEQGDAEAQFRLAECYRWGQGVKQSYEEAAMWYLESAKRGYASAQKALSECYEQGHGVPQSQAEACEWCRKAAEQGLAEAQNAMAFYYFLGRGVEKNPAEAARLWRAAADQQIPEAIYALALCYLDGIGVPQSGEEARSLLTQAAALGYEKAAAMLRELSQ